MRAHRSVPCAALLLLLTSVFAHANETRPFLQTYCADCHADGASEGEFTLESLQTIDSITKNFRRWEDVRTRIETGIMPPPDATQPSKRERDREVSALRSVLTAAQKERNAKQGRVTARRLNAREFENTLSDLLRTKLDVADLLPEDAKAQGFSTVGSALNVSSVQMEAYLSAIDAAIDQCVVLTEQPEQQSFHLSALNNNGYMVTYRDQHPALPVIDGMNLYATEAMSHHHALWGHYVAPREGRYRIRVSAYTVNTKDPIALTLRAGGNGHKESVRVKHELLKHIEVASAKPTTYQWEGRLKQGHYLHLYPSELPKRRFPINRKYEQATWKGPGVCVQWMEVEGPIVETWPPAGQEILFGGVPTEPIKGATNADPNAQLHSRPLIPADPRVRQTDWPPGGNKWKLLAGSINHKAKFVARDYSQRRQRIINRILAGKHEPAKPMPDYQSAPHNLPIGTPLPTYGGEPIYEDAAFPTVVRTQAFASTDPKADADRLIRRMLPLAFRRPVSKAMADRYVALVHDWIDEGVDFESAMRTGYKAIFTSPQFLFHQSSLPDETGKSVSLDDHALAERLAYFLWGSSPDEQLSQLAAEGQLSRGDTLREQTERMLADTRSNRFVEDFLGQWLDLHEINFTSPDLNLYPEYDPVLHWSMLHESHSFFRRLIDRDLPARNLIDSEFVTINRRLAQHYDLPAVEGMQASVVSVPADSVRGGVMTQAAVMKVTANGTNTSPVVRGVWVLERILGKPSPPPPPGIPAVEPDIRGAVTILQQLEKHRSDTACASCHARIDPPGVALEHFDPVGRFRTHYRVLNSKLANTKARPGRKRYQTGLPVDASYHLPGGQSFEDIRELKKIYAGDQAAIARMLAEHLLVYATGATTTFADDEAINQIVQQSAADEFGVRSLIHNVIQSKIFQSR